MCIYTFRYKYINMRERARVRPLVGWPFTRPSLYIPRVGKEEDDDDGDDDEEENDKKKTRIKASTSFAALDMNSCIHFNLFFLLFFFLLLLLYLFLFFFFFYIFYFYYMNIHMNMYMYMALNALKGFKIRAEFPIGLANTLAHSLFHLTLWSSTSMNTRAFACSICSNYSVNSLERNKITLNSHSIDIKYWFINIIIIE